MSVDRTRIEQEVEQHLRKRILSDGAEFTPDTPFADLGIDSITVIELVMFMEDKFGFDMPTEKLSDKDLSSVSDLIDRGIELQAN